MNEFDHSFEVDCESLKSPHCHKEIVMMSTSFGHGTLGLQQAHSKHSTSMPLLPLLALGRKFQRVKKIEIKENDKRKDNNKRALTHLSWSSGVGLRSGSVLLLKVSDF